MLPDRGGDIEQLQPYYQIRDKDQNETGQTNKQGPPLNQRSVMQLWIILQKLQRPKTFK